METSGRRWQCRRHRKRCKALYNRRDCRYVIKKTWNLAYNSSYHIALATGLAVEPCLFDDFGMVFRLNAKHRLCVEALMVPTHLSTGGRFATIATHDHFDAAIKHLHCSYML
ncbi:hypothetical protein RF11_13759 [Thelohanellus kitauei]|uniref:Uncharacterized protein n=1 Tax=Thelohanellus kitauei TaxID=669202 RepID=A0A0C2N1X1_THEKT|nr:hypothetical protein RF11_13759 [Thelohanellus kitauei]